MSHRDRQQSTLEQSCEERRGKAMMTWMVEGILVIAIVTIMYSMVAAWRE